MPLQRTLPKRDKQPMMRGRAALIKRILVPTDGSEGALEAAEYAVRLDGHFRAAVTLLYVQPPLLIMLRTPESEREQLRQELREGGQAILALTQTPFARAGIPVKTELRDGSPGEVVAAVAAQGGYDLIVIGSRGAGMSDSWLLGSVAERVARLAPCPVLIVRHGPAMVSARRGP